MSDQESAYGTPGGIALLHGLADSGLAIFTTEEARQTAQGIGLATSTVNWTLHELAKGQWITRLKPGLYVVNDPISKAARAHPFAVGTVLVQPAAISHWSSLNYWDLTEQIPNTVFVSSPKKLSRQGRARNRSGAAGWNIDQVSYAFTTVPWVRFFGFEQVWVTPEERVSVFDRERTILDMFYHFDVFGSFSTGLRTIEEHMSEINVERLVEYGQRFQVAAVAKRLGWALAMTGTPEEALEPLLMFPAKEESPLDPGLPSRGRHNRRWHVIENLDARVE